MTQAIKTHSNSILAKSACTLLSTCASSLLVPVALRHTDNVYNLILVLAVAAIWIASLTKMWIHVIGVIRSGMPSAPLTIARGFEGSMGSHAV